MSAITTHVLDTARGRPAGGIHVRLEMRSATRAWRSLAEGTTDADGRIRGLLSPDHTLEAGVYRLVFEVGRYLRVQQEEGFYPEVPVVFEVRDPAQHYHVPLLLSPFGYSTYRGS